LRLYSLEIKNFKSFSSDGTRLDFRPGLTMIAGPNGSGKSNIGDSLLFVLGTRSSKTVRADKLDDLIHNPDDNEKRKKIAGVTATFVEDTSNDSYEKVEISRFIEESGKDISSTYFINGKKAKHSEVDRFLENIGIQLDSYSFVLQGDINKFIYVTGNERRKLLEAVAGIDSYNTRINSAKEKIAEIDKMIMSSETLRDELEQNIIYTEKEAEKYRESKKLNLEIKDLKTTSISIQIRGIEIDLSGHEETLRDGNEKLEALKYQREQLRLDIERLSNERNEIEKGVGEKIQKELEELRGKLQDSKLEKARKEISISNLNKEISVAREHVEQNEEKIGNIEKEVLELGNLFNELNEREKNIDYREKSLKTQISQRIDVQKNKSNDYRKITDELGTLKHEIDLNDEKIAKIRREESNIQSQRKSIETKLGIKEESLSNEKYKLSETQWKLNQIKKDNGGSKSREESLSKSYFEAQSKLNRLEKERTEYRTKIDILSREVEKMRTEMGSQGFTNKSISLLMEAKARGNIKGIHRTIGELISYDDQHALAIEAAAGGRLNSLVVEDENVAQECIELLRDRKMGRVTFIPLNKILPGRPRGKALTIIQDGKGAILLSQTVKYQQVYENAIWYTFQDTVLVNNSDLARRYMTGVRIVTLDGDIYEASGAISGGFINKSKRTFNVVEMETKEKTLETMREEQEIRETEIKRLREQYESLSKELMEISKSGSLDAGRTESLESQLKDYKRNVENLEIEIGTLKIDLKDINGKLETTIAELEVLDLEKTRHEKRNSELLNKMGDTKEDGNDLSEMQRELEKISLEKNQCIGKKTETSTTLKKISERKSELSRELNELKDDMENNNKKKDDLDEEIVNINVEVKKLETMQEELNVNNRKVLQGLKEIEGKISTNENRISSLDNDMKNIENSILTSKIKIQNYMERIKGLKEEMDLTGGTVLTEYSSVQKISQELTLRNQRLLEIGAVNQLAEEDLERDRERLNSLLEKINKLKEEVDSLIKLMADLEDIKKNALLDLYTKVKVEMRNIFKRLTRGGDVDMYLSDEENPLDAELLIKAKPKGTVYTKLQSLSGGEKSLVALSFIVAVQRIKPSPIYFLDEIDMFLDGTNAEAMGELLRENSNTSQIIMISLKNAMGKYASSLFGVTMNKRIGCTEIFSKNFEGA
jgi:chromosome segregation protein